MAQMTTQQQNDAHSLKLEIVGLINNLRSSAMAGEEDRIIRAHARRVVSAARSLRQVNNGSSAMNAHEGSQGDGDIHQQEELHGV